MANHQQHTEESPSLSTEQKNKILLLQRQIMTLQLSMHNSQRQIETLGSALDKALLGLASELRIDADKWSFNLDTLDFVPKAS